MEKSLLAQPLLQSINKTQVQSEGNFALYTACTVIVKKYTA